MQFTTRRGEAHRPNDKFGLGYYFLNISNLTNQGSASDEETFTYTKGWLQLNNGFGINP